MGPEIIMIVVMIAVMYFLLIRPENKKKKAAEEMRASLKVGDIITTIGGIVGTICAVQFFGRETAIFLLTSGARRVYNAQVFWKSAYCFFEVFTGAGA